MMISIIAVSLVSLISLIGLIFFIFNENFLQKYLVYFLAFSAGAFLANSFFHLLPEIVNKIGFTQKIGFLIIGGVLFSFILEKIINWKHCHQVDCKNHNNHNIGIMSLIGDFFHNFSDGIIIASSFIISIPVGIATTISIIFHEIPQEISDFGVLIYSGFDRIKALILNFIISLSAILGVIFVFLAGKIIEDIQDLLIPFAVGIMLYIALADFVPHLHKENQFLKSIFIILSFIFGVLAILFIGKIFYI